MCQGRNWNQGQFRTELIGGTITHPPLVGVEMLPSPTFFYILVLHTAVCIFVFLDMSFCYYVCFYSSSFTTDQDRIDPKAPNRIYNSWSTIIMLWIDYKVYWYKDLCNGKFRSLIEIWSYFSIFELYCI